MDKRISILTTGGTIDKQYFDSLSEFMIVDTIVDSLLKEAKVVYPYKIEQVMLKDSLDLTDEDRLTIARYIEQTDSKKIVITHGTDTMSETAKVLSEQISDKTIVLTGALTPARFSESDAAFNLGMALAVAQTLRSGIYIAMNGTVFDALHVRKDRSAGRFVPIDTVNDISDFDAGF